jgi:hypothetical protein
MSKNKKAEPAIDHGIQFYALARAQARRVSGTPSGDPVLDQLGLYHPTGPAKLEPILKGLTVSQALRMCLIDWWTGGVVAAPEEGQGLRRLGLRLQRLVRENDHDLDRKVNDLLWLEHLGSVRLPQDIPARKVPWETCRNLILRIEKMTVRSLGQVHDLASTIMEPRPANHLIRLLRPVYEEQAALPDKDWAFVLPTAACGLAWATKGQPFGLHPSSTRQEAARTLASALLERSRDPALWPENDFAFSIDTLLTFSEFVWLYLKTRYPHLKDPPATGGSR